MITYVVKVAAIVSRLKLKIQKNYGGIKPIMK